LCRYAKNKTTIGNSAEVVTQKNTAMVEETNAAGVNPASQPSQLHDLISQYNLGADSHDDKHVATAHRIMSVPSAIARRENLQFGSPVQKMVAGVTRAFSNAKSPSQGSWQDF